MDIVSIVREELEALIKNLLAASVIRLQGFDTVVLYFRIF